VGRRARGERRATFAQVSASLAPMIYGVQVGGSSFSPVSWAATSELSCARSPPGQPTRPPPPPPNGGHNGGQLARKRRASGEKLIRPRRAACAHCRIVGSVRLRLGGRSSSGRQSARELWTVELSHSLGRQLVCALGSIALAAPLPIGGAAAACATQLACNLCALARSLGGDARAGRRSSSLGSSWQRGGELRASAMGKS